MTQAVRRPRQFKTARARAADRTATNAWHDAKVRTDGAVRDDRVRIAADLHDTVIQRLFAAGLALQGVLPMMATAEAARRVEATIDEMDKTIREIRSAIFALDSPGPNRPPMRTQFLTLMALTAPSLGFEPRLRLSGPVDDAITPDLSVHLIAVVREALANVARHAKATQANVTVTVTDRRIIAHVRDNGIAARSYTRPGGRGVSNLTHRAHTLGGSMTLTARTDVTGTTLIWQVPLPGRSRRRPARRAVTSNLDSAHVRIDLVHKAAREDL